MAESNEYFCGIKLLSLEDEIERAVKDFERRFETLKNGHYLHKLLGVDLSKESNFDACSQALISSALRCMSPTKFEKMFDESEKRIEFIEEHFRWIPIQEKTLSKFKKDSSVATTLIERGTASFVKKDYTDALEKYNWAAMFAGTEDKQLGLAFANRALVLIKMEDARGALEDIDLALKSNYPKSSWPKLEQRKAKCQKMLEEQEKYTEVKRKMDVTERRKYCEEFLFRVKNPNPLIPAADESVEIKWDKVMGRQLVVNRHVPSGTTVIVEDPFVSALDQALSWDTKHCHRCLKIIKRGFPCKNCVFALYCDENCLKKAAEEYHKFECKILSNLHCNSTPLHVLMALRIICKVGPSELLRLFTKKDPAYFQHRDEAFGVQKDCKYESESYLPVYHLINHGNKLDNTTCFKNALYAQLLVSMLQEQTTFFDGIPEDSKSAFKTFVANLMLRHIESIPWNNSQLFDLRDHVGITSTVFHMQAGENCMKNLKYLGLDKVAFGVYPVTNLMNHSCDPNVICVTDVKNGTQAFITNRTLKPGEPIFTNYTKTTFYTSTMPWINRMNRKILQDVYYFMCQCIACRNTWGPPDLVKTICSYFPHLNLSETELCCTTCSEQFCHEAKDSEEFQKCLLVSPLYRCGRCGERSNEELLRNALSVLERSSEDAMGCLRDNRLIDAFKGLLAANAGLQALVCPPHSTWYSNTVNLGKLLKLIVVTSVAD